VRTLRRQQWGKALPLGIGQFVSSWSTHRPSLERVMDLPRAEAEDCEA
jgi:hypothetical protein